MWIFAFVLFTEFFFLRTYIQSLKGTNIQASFILWEKQIEKNYQISNQKYADVLLQKFFYLINYSILFIKRYIWLVHVLLLNIQTPQYITGDQQKWTVCMQKNVNIKLYKGIILFILFWKITFYKTCQLKKLNETFIKSCRSIIWYVCQTNNIVIYVLRNILVKF